MTSTKRSIKRTKKKHGEVVSGLVSMCFKESHGKNEDEIKAIYKIYEKKWFNHVGKVNKKDKILSPKTFESVMSKVCLMNQIKKNDDEDKRISLLIMPKDSDFEKSKALVIDYFNNNPNLRQKLNVVRD